MKHVFFILCLFLTITCPKAEEFIEKKEKNFYLEIKARKFAQGEVVFLRIKTQVSLKDSILIKWENKKFNLLKNQNFIFLPIAPNFKKKHINLIIQNKNLFPKYENYEKSYKIAVEKTNFPFVKKKLVVNKKYVSSKLPQKTLKLIREYSKIKKKAFRTNTRNKVISPFVSPLKNLKVNSYFYNYRLYNNRKKSRPHGGADFKGKVGDPIYAINDGVVLIAQKMYYEGNFTVIDHGGSMFSLYMHQSEMAVKKNQTVKKGQLIGKVGATGRVTGPHLHLGLRIGNTLVDPLSVINMNFFED